MRRVRRTAPIAYKTYPACSTYSAYSAYSAYSTYRRSHGRSADATPFSGTATAAGHTLGRRPAGP
ncbi:hypothetical protein, partial [Streptomyces sp. 8L]|uniref:hypothetical protein n=1 Tax=Streptomyces sp. 8L TaxID=2877242 RepID=UPI001CD28F2A